MSKANQISSCLSQLSSSTASHIDELISDWHSACHPSVDHSLQPRSASLPVALPATTAPASSTSPCSAIFSSCDKLHQSISSCNPLADNSKEGNSEYLACLCNDELLSVASVCLEDGNDEGCYTDEAVTPGQFGLESRCRTTPNVGAQETGVTGSDDEMATGTGSFEGPQESRGERKRIGSSLKSGARLLLLGWLAALCSVYLR